MITNKLPADIVDNYSTKELYKFFLIKSTYLILMDLFNKNNLNYNSKMFDNNILMHFIEVEVSTFKNLLNINNRNITLRTSIVGPDTNPNGIGLFQGCVLECFSYLGTGQLPVHQGGGFHALEVFGNRLESQG